MGEVSEGDGFGTVAEGKGSSDARPSTAVSKFDGVTSVSELLCGALPVESSAGSPVPAEDVASNDPDEEESKELDESKGVRAAPAKACVAVVTSEVVVVEDVDVGDGVEDVDDLVEVVVEILVVGIGVVVVVAVVVVVVVGLRVTVVAGYRAEEKKS